MKLAQVIEEHFHDFVNLMFPVHCEACEESLTKGENIVCLLCEYELPKTNFHRERDNKIEKIFWGRVKIERAAAFYFFHGKSKVQRLLHKLKYHGKKEIGFRLGELFGEAMLESGFAEEIDLIVPVPLHEKRKRQRGYNQSDYFAMGLSESLKIDWSPQVLRRAVYTNTQTKKSRFERWGNVGEVFELAQPEKITGKHLLLVDDVITTGSTIEGCAHTLLQAEGAKVSIAAIAVAH